MDQAEREFERRWDLMKKVLGADARGEQLKGLNSGRTLFGIKSHAEEVLDRVAAEESERCLRAARSKNIGAMAQSDASAKEGEA